MTVDASLFTYYEATFGPGPDAGSTLVYTLPESFESAEFVALTGSMTRTTVTVADLNLTLVNKGGQARFFSSTVGAMRGASQTAFSFGDLGAVLGVGTAAVGIPFPTLILRGGDIFQIQSPAGAGDSFGLCLITLLPFAITSASGA